MNIHFKPGISILKDKQSGLIHFSISVSSLHKIYQLTPEYQLFIELLKSDHDVDSLFKKIKVRYPNFDKNQFIKNIDLLRKDGILSIKTDLPTDITTQDVQRYQRQVQFFSDLAPETIDPWQYQSKLKKASVLIIGLGGIGSWIAQSLAMIGVGKLVLCDFDTVSVHNLTRQTMYNINDIGTYKSEALSKHLKQNNTEINIKEIRFKMENEKDLLMLKSEIIQTDLVINCADFPDINTTSRWVSSLCMKLNKPHIIGGGYTGHIGLIGPTIIPFQGACWNCFERKYKNDLKDHHFDILLNTRKSSGAVVFLSSIIANIQAWDGDRVITGIGSPLMLNRKGFLDLDTLKIDWEIVSKDPNCEGCQTTSYDKNN